jgi:hypothetical protein
MITDVPHTYIYIYIYIYYVRVCENVDNVNTLFCKVRSPCSKDEVGRQDKSTVTSQLYSLYGMKQTNTVTEFQLLFHYVTSALLETGLHGFNSRPSVTLFDGGLNQL